jgi:DNA primase
MNAHLEPHRLKSQVSPSAFYSAELGLSLASAGEWASGGLCPFHNDSREGSFRVHLGSGGFLCFSCGAKGGDVIAFTRLRHRLSFSDALSYVARVGGAS